MSESDTHEPEFDIRRSVVHGLKWTASVRLANQVISWFITLFVIRLLRPDDYGLEAMASFAFYLLMLLSTAGIEQALIQTKYLKRDAIANLFGVQLLINLGLCAVQLALAPALGAYYREPRVVPILWVMAPAFMLMPFTTIPFALLGREMNFRHRSLAEMTKAAAASVSTLVLALTGFGVWALVWGQLVGIFAQAVFLNAVVRWLRFPRFSFRGVEHLVRFGGIVALTNIVFMLCWKMDIFLGGRKLEPDELGVYVVALHLAALPMEKLMPLLHQVALPAYSRIQDQPSEVTRYFLKTIRLVSLVTVPTLFGLAAVAQWVIPLLLGEKWQPAVLPITILALSIPLRAIGTMHTPLLNALGRPGTTLANGLTSLVILTIAFLIGLEWGVLGLCFSWLAAYPIVFSVNTFRVARILRPGLGRIVQSILPAAIAGVLMFLLLRGVARWSLEDADPWVVLIVLVPLGAAVYLGTMRVFFKQFLLEAIALAKIRT